MFEKTKLKFASRLYKNAYPLYRLMYFKFKKKKDRYNLYLIEKLVKPGSTAFDIGANVGFYSSFLSQIVGKTGCVYCFEPDIVNFNHLNKELKNKSNIKIFQKAVAAETGKLTLYTSDLLNIDHRTYEPESYNTKYDVEKVALDDFVNHQFKVDFIKMDIQGFEMDALQGMKDILTENEDIVLLTEFWPYGLLQAGSSALLMFNYFTNLGFTVYRIDKGRLTPLNAADVLSIKIDFMVDTNILVSRKEVIL